MRTSSPAGLDERQFMVPSPPRHTLAGCGVPGGGTIRRPQEACARAPSLRAAAAAARYALLLLAP
jgi:hypothetical protein